MKYPENTEVLASINNHFLKRFRPKRFREETENRRALLRLVPEKWNKFRQDELVLECTISIRQRLLK